MRVSDDDLGHLATLDAVGMRRWLGRRQPDEPTEQRQWWENVMMRALQATYDAKVDATRRDFARLAALATEQATEQGLVGARDGAIRLANLAAFYLSKDDAEASLFDVDAIVFQCLALIDVPPTLASAQVKHWQTLDVEQIRALRNAKNLIAPLSLMAHRVTDQALSERLSHWLRLRSGLP